MSDATAPSGATAATVGLPASSVRAPRWITLLLAVLFGLFYVYDVWEAVGNLVGMNAYAQNLDTQLSGFGWAVLVFAVLMPLLVFAGAFVLSHGRLVVAQGVIFFAGLCLVAVLSIDITVLFGLGRLIV